MRTALSNLPGRFALLSSFLLLFFMAIPRGTVQAAGAMSQEHIRVLAHLPLNGMHVNQMFVEQQGNRSYLYLHRTGDNAFAVVDVTRPSEPMLLSRKAIEEPARGQINPPAPGSVLAIALKPERTGQGSSASVQTGAAAAVLPTETVQLLDLSDPQNPKTLKTFEGVTSMFPESGRKLVYLVNSQGLWIIQHHALHPMPLCTSADALNPMPDCQ